MLQHKWTAWLLAGLIAAVMVGTPLSADAGDVKKKDAWGMADSPLGRLLMGNVGRMLVLKAELNLTEEQKDKICDVLEKHHQEIATELRDVWLKRHALRDLIVSDNANEEQIRQAASELGQAIGDVAVLGNRLWNKQLEPILTDQQEQLLGKFCNETDKAVQNFFDAAIQEKKADQVE